MKEGWLPECGYRKCRRGKLCIKVTFPVRIHQPSHTGRCQVIKQAGVYFMLLQCIFKMILPVYPVCDILDQHGSMDYYNVYEFCFLYMQFVCSLHVACLHVLPMMHVFSMYSGFIPRCKNVIRLPTVWVLKSFTQHYYGGVPNSKSWQLGVDKRLMHIYTDILMHH